LSKTLRLYSFRCPDAAKISSELLVIFQNAFEAAPLDGLKKSGFVRPFFGQDQ